MNKNKTGLLIIVVIVVVVAAAAEAEAAVVADCYTPLNTQNGFVPASDQFLTNMLI